MDNKKKVAIVGTGLVGKSWAMIFSSAGFNVAIYDIDPLQVQNALAGISGDMYHFDKDKVLRGKLSYKDQLALIGGYSNLAECIQDAVYIQECVPENLELKRKVWGQLDELEFDKDAILASSSSCIVPSKISDHLKHREQFLVAHPVNPPYHAPMVELVPAPWTNEATKARAREMMTNIGQVPVSLSRELPGFVLNRMQYALMNECFRLVLDDVVSVEDIDVVMKDGLGLRYAFMGPMETIHLNAHGLKKYCETYGRTIFDVSSLSGPVPEAWKMDTDEQRAKIEKINKQMTDLIPIKEHGERCLRRDRCLAALAKLKRQLDEDI